MAFSRPFRANLPFLKADGQPDFKSPLPGEPAILHHDPSILAVHERVGVRLQAFPGKISGLAARRNMSADFPHGGRKAVDHLIPHDGVIPDVLDIPQR